jgi:hypothetical protein
MRPILFIVALALSAMAYPQSGIDRLLAGAEPPAGVVFEIVEGDEGALQAMLPAVARWARQLRARFPGLPMALVTHGREQFGLLAREAAGPLASLHEDARSLREADIDLHVCGTHAGWYGHVPEDFPSYVDVSASGPAQIRDYLNLGYERVRLRPEDL